MQETGSTRCLSHLADKVAKFFRLQHSSLDHFISSQMLSLVTRPYHAVATQTMVKRHGEGKLALHML